jgi:hypothetical protein
MQTLEVPMLTALTARAHLAIANLRDRVTRLGREPDAGYNTEATIVTALLAAAAIVIVGIIVAKVTARAQSINLGP